MEVELELGAVPCSCWELIRLPWLMQSRAGLSASFPGFCLAGALGKHRANLGAVIVIGSVSALLSESFISKKEPWHGL